MTTEHQNEVRELAGNEIDAVAGGGHPNGPADYWTGAWSNKPTGFGVRTDTMIAVQAAMSI